MALNNSHPVRRADDGDGGGRRTFRERSWERRHCKAERHQGCHRNSRRRVVIVSPSPGFSRTCYPSAATCDGRPVTREQAIAWGYPRRFRLGFAETRSGTVGVAGAPLPGRCARPKSVREREEPNQVVPAVGV
jgi:hypothetical protein